MLSQFASVSSLAEQAVPPYLKEMLQEQESIRKLRESLIPKEIADLVEIQKQLCQPIQQLINTEQQHRKFAQRWADALAVVQTELPKRGWYLTGQELAEMTPKIAELAENGDYKAIDEILFNHASKLNITIDRCIEWLEQQGTPEYCRNRFKKFIEAKTQEHHEIATLIGVPLIDELSRCLFSGKDFTTKRGKGKVAKPQMACTTSGSESKLNQYYEGFVNSFGLIHEDVDPSRLEDENYFNRSAIVHGMMRRSYGPKDTAKVFMVLMFLIFACDERNHQDGST